MRPGLALCLTLALLVPSARAAAPAVEVEIEGLDDAQRDNVRSYLSIWIYRDAEAPSEASVRRLHARAPDEIRQALQPFGRYRPEIEAELETTGTGWRARYRVTPGPEVRLAAVDVAIEGPGGDDPAFAGVTALLPIKPGDPLRHAAYEQAKLVLQTIAEDHGYLDARFAHSALEVDPEAGSAVARLSFATGPRFRFGPLEFEQDALDPELVRRYAGFEPGDVFSVAKLLALQYALNDSDYFSLVEIEPQREATDADGRIPVKIRLLPRPAHKYTFGFGFGTDTGPRVSLGAENRRLNRGGHRIGADLQWSEVKQQLTARWSVPLARPATERLTWQAALTREEFGDTVGRTLEVGVALSKQLGPWLQTGYVEYKQERSQLPDAPDERSQLVIPGVIWSRTLRDDPVYPGRGYRFSFELRGSHDGFGSDASFVQGRMSAKAIRSFGARTRLIARGDLGRTYVDRFSDLPVSERFFTGGDQTVRGFDYNTLGPVDADGNVIGGRALGTASVELERMLFGKWGAAIFVDAGDAADQVSGLALREAAGVGLRWRSPVGMVRVDVARPLDEVSGNDPRNGWRLHFSIGPDL